MLLNEKSSGSDGKFSLKGAKALNALQDKLLEKIADDPALQSVSTDLLEQMKEIFVKIDTEQNGLVSKMELKKFMKEHLKDRMDRDLIIKEILAFGDNDLDGHLTFKDFVQGLTNVEVNHNIDVLSIISLSSQAENMSGNMSGYIQNQNQNVASSGMHTYEGGNKSSVNDGKNGKVVGKSQKSVKMADGGGGARAGGKAGGSSLKPPKPAGTSVNPKLKQAMMKKAQKNMSTDKNTVVPFGGNFIKFMQHISTDPYLKMSDMENRIMALLKSQKDEFDSNLKTVSGKMGIGMDGIDIRLRNQEKNFKKLLDDLSQKLDSEIYKTQKFIEK